MHAVVLGASLQGIEARIVQVEVDISPGLPATRTVGLPEAAAREGHERVRSAIQNSGFPFPCKRIVINLAPADLRKRGAALDLAVAVAILAAGEGLDLGALADRILYGELGLDGSIRPVPGALAASMAVRSAGLRGLVLAGENAAEAAALEGPEILLAGSLAEVVEHLREGRRLPRHTGGPGAAAAGAEEGTGVPLPQAGLEQVRGQAAARRALEVAAAGGHNLLLIGPPGAGKTMLARCLPGLLPALSQDESIEVTRIHGALGTGVRQGLIRVRPFRSPHHTVSRIALVGGGPQARPGEVSLAHHGVLFLDELPEFRRDVLEVLREPLEERVVSIARAARRLVYPASFMLVAAMNPCRCGHRGDPRRPCECTPHEVARYRSRISGPLLDRIDLHVEVPPVPFRDLNAPGGGEPSSAVAARVREARERQRRRYAGNGPVAGGGVLTNAQAPPAALREHARPDASGLEILGRAMSRLGLSARAHDRILRVARTIADLRGAESAGAAEIGEALQHRCLDRPVGEREG